MNKLIVDHIVDLHDASDAAAANLLKEFEEDGTCRVRSAISCLDDLITAQKFFPVEYEEARRVVFGDAFVDGCKQFWGEHG